jgi:hypothetical protein
MHGQKEVNPVRRKTGWIAYRHMGKRRYGRERDKRVRMGVVGGSVLFNWGCCFSLG